MMGSRGSYDPGKVRRCWTLASIAGIWAASDIGYYLALPVLDQIPNYNEGPVAIALYYVYWTGITVIVFWPVYASWSSYAKWTTFGDRLTSIIIWSLAFAGAVVFAVYVLPALPPFDWREALGSTPELPRATSQYFLPKSVEILLQQLLVVALVLTLSAENFSLRKISIYCAILFGGSHVLLAFGDVPWSYVIRFATVATLFGLAFPYLILRVPNGFAYSYAVHWAYYAITVLMARMLGPGTVREFVKQLFDGV